MQKKLLLQAAACNLGLLLRPMLGAGTPRALRNRLADLFLLFFWMRALAKAAAGPRQPLSGAVRTTESLLRRFAAPRNCCSKTPGLDTGC